MQTTRYKNDGALRRRLFTPESYSHPAKGHMGMWEDIITRYTKEGDTVLDPMSGVGSTLLAALMGRNVVCVELEEHFVTMLKANWEKARQHPMLGYSLGNVAIIHGDARNLTGLLADAVITSPPWEEQNIRAVGDEKYGSQRTGGMRRQIKNTNPYTRPSAIITSPPWEDQGESHSTDKTTADHSLLGKAYTRPVDAVVTSPPYEGGGHHEGAENIGNMRGAKYWGEQGMTAVYRQCYAVLKPGGVMALVVKGFTRDGKYVDLPTQTVEVVENCHRMLYCQCETQDTTKLSQGAYMPGVRRSSHKSGTHVQGASAPTSSYTTPQRADKDSLADSSFPTSDYPRTRGATTNQSTLGNSEEEAPRPSMPDVRGEGESQEGASEALPQVLFQGQDLLGESTPQQPWKNTQSPSAGNGVGELAAGKESELARRHHADNPDSDSISNMEGPTPTSVGEGQPSVRLLRDDGTPHSPSHGSLDANDTNRYIGEPANAMPRLPCASAPGTPGATCPVCGRTYYPEEVLSQIGFALFDRWARELWSLSFWRILQKRRDPAAFDERLNFEEVLAFRKPADAEAQEPSVDAAVFSPPFQDERQGGGLATREYQERSIADGTAASGLPGRKHTRIDEWGYTRPKAQP